MIKALLKLAAGIILLAAAVVCGPLAGIWALNTLFPVLSIQYTIETWAAFFVLFGSVSGLRYGSK